MYLNTIAYEPVGGIGRRLEAKDFKRPKHGFELGLKPLRVFLASPVTQFRSDDEAGTDLIFTNLADVLCHCSLAGCGRDRRRYWCRGG